MTSHLDTKIHGQGRQELVDTFGFKEDEIILTLKELGEELYDKQGTDSYNARCLNHDKKAFFKEVKNEIEKLTTN